MAMRTAYRVPAHLLALSAAARAPLIGGGRPTGHPSAPATGP